MTCTVMDYIYICLTVYEIISVTPKSSRNITTQEKDCDSKLNTARILEWRVSFYLILSELLWRLLP